MKKVLLLSTVAVCLLSGSAQARGTETRIRCDDRYAWTCDSRTYERYHYYDTHRFKRFKKHSRRHYHRTKRTVHHKRRHAHPTKTHQAEGARDGSQPFLGSFSLKQIADAITGIAQPILAILRPVIPPLAVKVTEIVNNCGSRIVSVNAGHSYFVRGTNRVSLHKLNKAVDVVGNPKCIYMHLKKWPGGYSTDYAAVNHVHISYSPHGREWGARFAHRGHSHRYARRHQRHQYRMWARA